MMLLAEGEKEPAMLEDIENRAEIPEGRDHESDVARDALQFSVEGSRIFDVLDGMGAEGVLELVGGEGKLVDAVDHDQVGNLGMLDDVDIEASSVGSATTDVEIPLLAPVSNDPTHDSVAEEIQGGKENDEGGAEDEEGEEHERQGQIVGDPETKPSSSSGQIEESYGFDMETAVPRKHAG